MTQLHNHLNMCLLKIPWGKERAREIDMYICVYVYIFVISNILSMLFQFDILNDFFVHLIYWLPESYVKISIVDLFIFPCSSVSFCFLTFENLVSDKFKFGIIIFLKILIKVHTDLNSLYPVCFITWGLLFLC